MDSGDLQTTGSLHRLANHRRQAGELLVVFSGDRDAHVCPWGKTQLVRSGDEGETWSTPEVIRDSPLDDRDAGIIETAGGTLLASWIPTLFAVQQDPSETLREA